MQLQAIKFQPVDSGLLFSRNDPSDPRLGEKVSRLPLFSDTRELGETLSKAIKAPEHQGMRHFVVAGYPDDEGIQINGGRLGASQAPPAVRRPLYKMTPSLLSALANSDSQTGFQANPKIWDLGDLKSPLAVKAGESSIESRHEVASSHALQALQAGATWLSIGGGHDYGFPDADAFVTWAKANGHKRPLVLNFDAHLDVRPTSTGISSGTPFYRLLEKHPDIDFAEIGIQSHCNSAAHVQWLQARGGRVLLQEEAEASGQPWSTFMFKQLEDWLIRPRPAFLSIDIDGFTSMAAPGCSQSWSTGYTPQDFFPFFDLLLRRLEVKGVGIYEVSPPLDQDDRTAKLAAQILHRTIYTPSAHHAARSTP